MEWSMWICIGVITTVISQVASQIYINTGQDLTSFPADIPANTRDININWNSISNFPKDAFEPFYQLEVLNIGGNPFTELPNLMPVGDTLKKLYLTDCNLNEVNATIFNELRVLEFVSWKDCASLTSIPNVPGPGNTLQRIDAKSCSLSTFPALSHYKALRLLYIPVNPIPIIRETDLAGIPPTLQQLYVYDTLITSLPEYPRAWQNMTWLDMLNTNVAIVPLMCPRADITIDALHTPVSLCDCRNVWLKALDGQRGSIRKKYMTCGSASTTDELLQQQCQRPQTAVRQFTAELKHRDFFCHFPVHSFTTGVTKIECTVKCLDTLGCSSIGFRQTNGRLGNCVILAPTDSALTDIPDADSPGWKYLTVG